MLFCGQASRLLMLNMGNIFHLFIELLIIINTFSVYGKQVPIARAVLQASIDGKKIEPGNDL